MAMMTATSMTTKTATLTDLKFPRLLSDKAMCPFNMVIWKERDAQITGSKGNVVFEQKDVRVSSTWSDTTMKIVANKYLHGTLDIPAQEGGVDEPIQRVITTISHQGHVHGHFASQKDEDTFRDEWAILLLQQYVIFNLSAWFNIGCDILGPENNAKYWHWNMCTHVVEASRSGHNNPQCSACFINSVADPMGPIMGLAKVEVMLFKWGPRGRYKPVSGPQGQQTVLRQGRGLLPEFSRRP
ncbi:MAG: hypothetical protein ACP5EP_12465 [Acidobacteriaceae bacterium]